MHRTLWHGAIFIGSLVQGLLIVALLGRLAEGGSRGLLSHRTGGAASGETLTSSSFCTHEDRKLHVFLKSHMHEVSILTSTPTFPFGRLLMMQTLLFDHRPSGLGRGKRDEACVNGR